MSFPAHVVALATNVRLLLLDVDGVLTDGRLYYGADGAELKAFATQDGAAIKMLLGTGIDIALVTGRSSAAVARRAHELGIHRVYQNAHDKALVLESIVAATAIAADRMAHVGDDLPDLPLFNRVAMKITVPGAHPVVTARADYVTTALPGAGAVREVCELLMHAHGTWDRALAALDR